MGQDAASFAGPRLHFAARVRACVAHGKHFENECTARSHDARPFVHGPFTIRSAQVPEHMDGDECVHAGFTKWQRANVCDDSRPRGGKRVTNPIDRECVAREHAIDFPARSPQLDDAPSEFVEKWRGVHGSRPWRGLVGVLGAPCEPVRIHGAGSDGGALERA